MRGEAAGIGVIGARYRDSKGEVIIAPPACDGDGLDRATLITRANDISFW